MSSRLCLMLPLLPVLAAQTYIVDVNNGPGTNFVDLPTAVAAVPDGAVLLVRAGNYAGFTVAGKGLAILGDPRVAITDTIWISATLPHQAFTLRGLVWPQAYSSSLTDLLLLSDCGGPVLIEAVAQPPASTCLPASWPGTCFRAVGVHAVRCSQLTLRDCTILCTASFADSEVVLEATTVRGEAYGVINNQTVVYARNAVTLYRGSLQVAGGSLIRGGDGNGPSLATSPDGHGIFMDSASLRLLDGAVGSGQGSLTPPVGYAVIAAGTNPVLRLSPRVLVTASGSPRIVGAAAVPAPMPELTGSSAPAGGTLGATVTTESGDLVVLAVGFPGPAIFVAGMHDPFWLDPVVHFFVAVGAQGGTPIGGAVAVPSGPAFVGLRLGWQAACYGPVTGFQATNPVVTLVR
ncbi:MAG: hypothetical protein FJ265_07375 [Planctomycetes bacterium]|nr:hypothetical protein [Planctomycetota bacterium]